MTATLDNELAALRHANAELQQRLDTARAERDEAEAQKAALAEVLDVINSSPGALAPVFDTMLEEAMRLCEAAFGGLWTFEGEQYIATALRGVPAAYAEFLADKTLAILGPGTAPYRFQHGERAVIQNIDLADEEPYRAGEPNRRALVDLGGARTALQVPLCKDEAVIGVITIYRQEVRPFAQKQIALLQSFAAQAVIAIENARLLAEPNRSNSSPREALEQQTATAEVLQVINSSPGELAPVFRAILEKALRLCGAAFGMMNTYDGKRFQRAADYGVPPAYAEFRRHNRQAFAPDTAPGRILAGEDVVHNIDLKTEHAYERGDPNRRALVLLGGARSHLAVALRKDSRLIGHIGIYRQEVRPFTDKQITLLQNFAAQAVIAMDNARLITETRDALEQQTATAEVLQVINSSPGDLRPVFEAMLEKALRLCGAALGNLLTYDGECFQAAAGVYGSTWVGPARELSRAPIQPVPGGLLDRLLKGDHFIHTEDVKSETAYLRNPGFRELVDGGGYRSMVHIALRRDSQLLGAIVIFFTERRMLTDKQIALLQNFAAQAVIAMENARLINETQEALEQQTATAEVLGVINSSPGDLAPVFDAILEKAHSLCGAEFGGLLRYDGASLRLAAERNLPPAWAELVRGPWLPRHDHPVSRIMRGERLLQIADMAEIARTSDDPMVQAAVERGGIRTLLLVPLRKDNAFLGYITAYRQEVRPFSDKQIVLLENFAAQAVIAMENARLITETREALEQQTATAEVLQVINSSPGDLTPVFDAMLEKAMSLCDAAFGELNLYDGKEFHVAAVRNLPVAFAAHLQSGPRGFGPGTGPARMLAGEHVLFHLDLKDEDIYRSGNPNRRALVDLGGARSALQVALVKDDAFLGFITVFRQEVRSFTQKQVTILKNFAAQAVIAMENARLITETREALEQQTATAEVLGVINSSPGELTPVFEAMLDKAMQLCAAVYGGLWTWDGQKFNVAALRGVPSEYAEFAVHHPRSAKPDTALGRLVAGADFAQVMDAQSRRTTDEVAQKLVELGGIRTLLGVPLRKQGVLLGVFVIYRQEVRAFTDKQIALLQNFAAQAVIAMENARLITETREALEQQTATAEVLGVINSSPGNLAPVFDSILEKAHALCGAPLGSLQIYDGESFRAVATRGMPEPFAAMLRQGYRPPPGSPRTRLLDGEPFVQIADMAKIAAEMPDDAIAQATVTLAGIRTLLRVALRKDGALLGTIVAGRQEVQPFTDKQIGLLQNFAAQAVIAMDNARLITETREALEQQTATAEVLGVINSSPGDLTPVFDTMLEKATRLCNAAFGILAVAEGDRFHTVAARNLPAPLAEWRQQNPVVNTRNTLLARVLAGEPYIHTLDLKDDELYRRGEPLRRANVDLGGARTSLYVPLIREGDLLGTIHIYRQEVRAFSEKQIALLQNFATQAVIAMENARLITETREALEQQTATAEVLQVINSSPGKLAPVFEAMLEKAARLCNARFGLLWLYEADEFRVAAVHAVPPRLADFVRKPLPAADSASMADIVHGESIVHVPDLADSELYRSGNPARRAYVDLGGARTLVSLALRKDNALLGAFNIYRQEVRPFSDKEVKLVENFAAQAVIAIENARLITETREALDQQTATAEVLGVINSSPGDLEPVFAAMLEKATDLCEATFGILWVREGEEFHAAAARGVPDAYMEVARHPLQPRPENPLGRMLRGESLIVSTDVAAEEIYWTGDPARRALVDLGGAHSAVQVALVKDDGLLGSLTVFRQEVRPFTDKQIALLQNFAAQAVVAMENARLITETREALEQQTATAEVLRVINTSPGDLAPVFDALLDKATTLCDAAFGVFFTYDGEQLHTAALRGTTPAYTEFLRNTPHRPGPSDVHTRLIAGEAAIQFADVIESPGYRAGDPLPRAFVDLGGGRTVLAVALRKDDVFLGEFAVYRREVRPFTEKQIALVQNFAAQAVIAIENARLLTETREALEQQTATAEVLGVINSSPGDLGPVFQAILQKAHRLCAIAYGSLQLYETGKFHAVAVHGLSEALADHLRQGYTPGPNNPLSRLLEGDRFVHVHDLAEIDDPMARRVVELGGTRTLLWVALRKENRLLGMIVAARLEVRPFSDKEIALLQSFAAQAVIAMENARLLNEIRQRQAELRITFDNMGDGVVMFDESLRLAAWNRNFQELLDLSDDVLADRPSYSDYLRVLANRGEFGTIDVEAEVARRMIDTDQEFRQERTRPDGRVIEVRRNAVPDGGFVLIYSDITERKRSEAEIRAARDAAEAAYRDLKAAQANLVQAEKMASLGQLTAGIAHEIKNPLNFVNNFAGLSVELLDELKEATAPALDSLPEQDRVDIDETIGLLTSNLEKIAEHGKRADGIVKSMLEHSRGGTGERRVVDLNGLIEEALNLAYHGGRAQDQSFNITLERDYGSDIAPIELVPQDITRVCLNLFGNGFYAATKRLREGSDLSFKPTLTISTRDLGDAVEIRTRDNGTGIPPEIKDKLFQPFFTTKPSGEGTGLGLSISYDIITQEHGGTIEVDSEVGKFTEFTIRLPRSFHGASTGAAA